MTKNADIPVKYSFDDKKRDIIPVLGQGAIKIDARAQALQEKFSRDVRDFIGKATGQKASLDAAIPISDIAEFLKTSFSSKDVSGISAGDGPEKEESEEETEQEKERRLLLEKAEKQKLEHEIKSAEEKISSTLKKKYANDIPEFSQDGEIAEKQSLILCDMMDKIAASGASDGLMEITNIAFALYMDTESGQKGQASPEQIDSAIAEAKSFMSKGELSPALSKLALGKQSYDEYQGLVNKKTQFDKGNFAGSLPSVKLEAKGGIKTTSEEQTDDRKQKLLKDINYYSALAEGHGSDILLSSEEKQRFQEAKDKFTTDYILKPAAKLSVMYQGFQEEYPVIATVAGPAIIVGGTFFLVGSGAWVPVAVTEASALLHGAIINEAAGDKIAKGIGYASDKIGNSLKNSYPALTDDEAKALGLGSIMLGSSLWSIKGSVQTVKTSALKTDIKDTHTHFNKIEDGSGVRVEDGAKMPYNSEVGAVKTTATKTPDSQQFIDKAVQGIFGDEKIVKGSQRELVTLEVKLACKQLETQKGLVIAGSGHTTPIHSINNLIATYGGKAEDWAKMTSKSIEFKEGVVLKPNTKIQLHWYENIKTGERVLVKPVIKNK